MLNRSWSESSINQTLEISYHLLLDSCKGMLGFHRKQGYTVIFLHDERELNKDLKLKKIFKI